MGQSLPLFIKRNMGDTLLDNLDLADAIIERPQGFQIGHRHFYLYPVTLGKMYLLARLIDSLKINEENLKVNAFLEALRLVRDNRKTICRIISYHTCKGKNEVFNNVLVMQRVSLLMKQSDSDLATVFIMVLQTEKTSVYIKRLGIDKEQKRMQDVMKLKGSKNVLSFGGKSIYGTIIDAACERYGWAYDYVVWGISYTNLRLMLADSIKTVTLSDKERKSLHIHDDREVISGDNKDSINEFIRTHNFK